MSLLILVLMSLLVNGVICVTLLHAPKWLQSLWMRIPAWLQLVLVHVGFAMWIGGVTGHLIALVVTVPFGFINWFWLRPEISENLADYQPDFKRAAVDGVHAVRGWLANLRGLVSSVTKTVKAESEAIDVQPLPATA